MSRVVYHGPHVLAASFVGEDGPPDRRRWRFEAVQVPVELERHEVLELAIALLADAAPAVRQVVETGIRAYELADE